MAIFQVTVTAGNNPARTYTVDAADEAAAKKEAIRQAFSQPNARNLRMSQMEVKKEDIVEQFDEGRSNEELQAEKDLAAQLKIFADEGYSELAKVGEEAVQTAEMPSFSAYADTLGENPAAGFRASQGYQPPPAEVVKNFSQDDPTALPVSASDIASNQAEIEAAAAAAAMAAGGSTSLNPYQTEAGRRSQLESSNTFASFLDELDKAGLGGLQGSAGRFMRNQFDPLEAAYQAQQILPLAQGEVPFGQDLRNLAPEDAEAYQQALARQQANKYVDGYGNLNAGAAGGLLSTSQGPTAPFTKEEDEATIAAYSPSFGAYAQGALQGGGRQAQQRIGQQLQSLSQMNMENQAPGSFASQMLAPESGEQAGFLLNLAEQAQKGRYSPVAQRALQSYMNPQDIWADYSRQSTPMVGANMAAPAPPPNFAQFIGQRYGLF
jgi:hypothetical protein